eukprot:GHVH01004616.1.p1 GENE.GHVH01004616.1~~GHVH01004616.1.p1  ORF type:complete len:1085 (+),score=195.82 GHVH01004616.1:74-3328(+)
MARREYVRDIEKSIQAYWSDNHIGDAEPIEGQEKYFITFPYPYMNGALHLGHCFSLTKPEIAARFKRLQGYNVLWPFGLHCTGMPIMSAADKLKNEELGFEAAKDKDLNGPIDVELSKERSVFGREKTKVVQKNGTAKKQSDIMRAMGIPEDMVFKFSDPQQWLDFFPQKCISDLKCLGFSGDLRRSFITTERNLYYDSFIRWQFTTLKERGFIGFGMRPTVFSAVDDQPCLDHDRSAGEGATPQEYTLVKVKINNPKPEWDFNVGSSKNYYLVCATLRPETMYGQTNVFVLPHGEYKLALAFSDKMVPRDDDVCARLKHSKEEARVICQDVFIASDRSLCNMMHQGIIPMTSDGTMTYHQVGECKGWDLLGMSCSAPLTPMKEIFALPMTSISMDKGTGIVTSVPSDSPDDYVNIRELQRSEEMRKKYLITEEMVNFDVIEIVDIPGYGRQAAVVVSERLGIKNPDDKNKLIDAKTETYTKGYYEGTLVVGDFAGTLVCDCKPLVRQVLLDNQQAMIYHEPDKKVVSRSGDICVVAQLNQWYLTYGEEAWKKNVREWIDDGLNTFNETVRKQFLFVVDWLDNWACTRNYGLGTKCPWESDQLIESLSDSTIYFAYYTVKHLLHADLHGDVPGILNIEAKQLTHEFWNYIMTQTDEYPVVAAERGIPKDKADRCRSEFNYWYPMNLRTSAKDLVPNHLTMSLFHHEAIWPGQAKARQNQEYFVNGHVLVDNEKMAKSAGNFLTMAESIETFTADGVRIACSLAGDTTSDANFERPVAEAALLKLYTLIQNCQKIADGELGCRGAEEPLNGIDKMFEAQISKNAEEGYYFFNCMKYREAMRSVYFEMLNSEGRYLVNVQAMGVKPHAKLLHQWMETITVILSPVAPHTCEHIYRNILKNSESVSTAKWPIIEVNASEVRKADIFSSICEDLRKERQKKGGSKVTKAIIYIRKEYLDWQVEVLDVLENVCEFDSAGRLVDLDAASVALRCDKRIMSLPKKTKGVALAFGIFHLKEEVAKIGRPSLEKVIQLDEEDLLHEFEPVVLSACAADELVVLNGDAADHPDDKSKGKTRLNSRPMKPSVLFL